LYKQKASIKY